MVSTGSRSKYIALTLLLGAVIVAAVVAVNRHFFFEARLYEFADAAANSLEVLRAKKFECYYGAYSRWGFHHPGPVLFYCYALGETLFWQWLHLVPTPLNGQLLMVLVVTAGFLASGIGVAARWVRSAVFVPLALLLATRHFLTVHLEYSMLAVWPPYVMPIPFFCLVVAAASVAAGQGEDLPLLALTGCFIIHSHVAHPLFVLPLFAVAYAGLWWTCRRSNPRPLEKNPAPWRGFPRAHLLAAVIVAAFVLPIAIDLSHGSDSNFALILHHLRTHRGEHHPYLDAVYYFVRFGAYRHAMVVSGVTSRELTRYIFAHPWALGLWSAALLSPVPAWGLRRWLVRPAGSGAASEPAESRPAARWRFLGWLGVCLALTTALAIFWAHIQDGEMLYYNAWFNYGIYAVLALFAAVALSDALETVAARRPRLRHLPLAAALLCVVLTVVSFVRNPDGSRATQSDTEEARACAATVFAALAEHPDAPRMKFITVPDDRALAPGPCVALLLKRLGYEFRVDPTRKTMFGYENALGDSFPASLLTAKGEVPMEIWHLLYAGKTPEAAKRPLLDGWVLQNGSTKLDPSTQPVIAFSGPDYNANVFAIQGFAEPDPNSTHTLAIGQNAVLDFRPEPVPAETAVEIVIGFAGPFIDPAKHPVQRLQVRFNGADLGTFTASATEPEPAMRVLVPAAQWNAAQPTALLTLGMPDAVSPQELYGPGKDPRVLSFAATKITFRVVNPSGSVP